MAASATASYRDVVRARIVLLAAQSLSNAEIGRRVGCHVDVVRCWRRRFSEDPRAQSLQDRPRSGRPARVPVEARCELVKLACDRPDKAPMREVWTQQALADTLAEQTGWRLSRSEVGRVLAAHELQPHRVRMWLHSPDPDFRTKVRRICRLYLDPPAGATVLCVDEKTSIQALERLSDTRAASPGRPGRFEFEYVRHGVRALLAAFDVRTGRVLAHLRPQRTARDLVSFMEHVARRRPRGDVYVVWDNLNIHYDGKDARWTRFNERHGGRFHFVYTPLHASWMNQVELWFSILQRRVLTHADVISREHLAGRIRAFITRWNRSEAHPFRWTFRGRFRDDTLRAVA
jgi:transposase